MMNMSPLMMARLALERPEMLAQMMASQGKMPPSAAVQATPNTLAVQPQPQTLMAGPQIPTLPSMPGEGMPAPMGDVPTPPTTNRPAPQGHGSTAKPDLQQLLPAMGDVPTPPQLPTGSAVAQPSALLPTAGDIAGAILSVIGDQTATPGGPDVTVPPYTGLASSPPPAVTAPPAQVNPSQQLGAALAPITNSATIAPHPASSPVPLQQPPVYPTAAAPTPTAPAGGPSAVSQDGIMAALSALSVPQSGGGSASARVGTAPAPYIQGAVNPQVLEILKAALATPGGPGALSSYMR